jgi:hypothetical protein
VDIFPALPSPARIIRARGERPIARPALLRETPIDEARQSAGQKRHEQDGPGVWQADRIARAAEYERTHAHQDGERCERGEGNVRRRTGRGKTARGEARNRHEDEAGEQRKDGADASQNEPDPAEEWPLEKPEAITIVTLSVAPNAAAARAAAIQASAGRTAAILSD